MKNKNTKPIIKILTQIFFIFVLSLLLFGCVWETFKYQEETEVPVLREEQKKSENVTETSGVEGTSAPAERKWKEDFLEKVKQLLQEHISGFGKGLYDIYIEDFTSHDSSTHIMILKNERKMWTCEVLCQMKMDDGSVLEDVVYDRRWSEPVKLSDKTLNMETVKQQIEQSAYKFSVEINEIRESNEGETPCIEEVVKAYQNAKNREKWDLIMAGEASYSATQKVTTSEADQVNIYCLSAKRKRQYYFVNEAKQTCFCLDYDIENDAFASFFRKEQMEKWKELEQGHKAEYLCEKTIMFSTLSVQTFLEDDWPLWSMMESKDVVEAIIEEEWGEGEYILYIKGFSDADVETEVLILNEGTNQLYHNRLQFTLSGKKIKVKVRDGKLLSVDDRDCGGISFHEAFAKVSICKIRISIG